MNKKGLVPVLVSLIILFSVNLLMVSSLAPSSLLKQIIAWLIGIVAFFIGQQINPKQLSTLKWPIFIIICLLLALPILLDQTSHGSRRWINFAFINFQPSEAIKPWLMIFLVNTLFPLLIIIPTLLMLIQPDLGSAIMTLTLLFPLFLYRQKIRKQIILACIFLLTISPILWSTALHDYQKNRLITFLNPTADPLGQGYNVIQSQIAIGSAGFWGRGYKKGTQSHLLFLPEKHTDFMFSATTEEIGLVGSFTILFAYFFLLRTLLKKAYQSKSNSQHFLFTLGITGQIWLQILINIGMNLGLMPVTGLPLPFLSVGGSSLITTLFSLGIIYSS